MCRPSRISSRSRISAGLLAFAVFAAGPVSATDTSKVEAATKQVESGAKKIGDGTEQTAKGIGTTVVEGTKVTGEKLKEAAKASEPHANTAAQQAKDGAVSFGTSIKTFFTNLFSK